MSEKIYKNLESLEPVKKVLNEADIALQDRSRTIETSSIPDALGGALGVGIGGAVSFAALYFGGTVGLSAVGITTGLATAGAIVGGGMAAGVAVLAAPVAILGIVGFGLISTSKAKKLKEAKESLLQEIIRKHDAIIRAKSDEINKTKGRADYLESLNIMLQAAIKDLRADLA